MASEYEQIADWHEYAPAGPPVFNECVVCGHGEDAAPHNRHYARDVEGRVHLLVPEKARMACGRKIGEHWSQALNVEAVNCPDCLWRIGKTEHHKANYGVIGKEDCPNALNDAGRPSVCCTARGTCEIVERANKHHKTDYGATTHNRIQYNALTESNERCYHCGEIMVWLQPESLGSPTVWRHAEPGLRDHAASKTDSRLAYVAVER